MINIEHRDRLVAVTVFGEFALADYKEFEELENYKIQFSGPIDLLFDLREMAGFTLDVAGGDQVRASMPTTSVASPCSPTTSG